MFRENYITKLELKIVISAVSLSHFICVNPPTVFREAPFLTTNNIADQGALSEREMAEIRRELAPFCFRLRQNNHPVHE